MNYPIYITVLMSTYNDEKYIETSIKSILDQTYPYFEFIIVNDGSTDNTLQIIKRFHDDRIIVINKSNTGLSDSLNVGISRSKYEWIARMDGDDIALPDRLEKQVKMIGADVAVIGGQVDYLSSTDIVTPCALFPISDRIIRFYLGLGVGKIVHPTALLNKSILQKIGGYDINLFGAEDFDLWIRLCHYGKLINIPDKVLLYRKNPNGVSIGRKEIQLLKFLIVIIKKQKGVLGQLDDKMYKDIEEKLTSSVIYRVYKKCFKKHEMSKGINRKLQFIKLILLQKILPFAIK